MSPWVRKIKKIKKIVHGDLTTSNFLLRNSKHDQLGFFNF
jgi:tRNA A-37 threonylcarbamoyl transferase component Bud32